MDHKLPLTTSLRWSLRLGFFLFGAFFLWIAYFMITGLIASKYPVPWYFWFGKASFTMIAGLVVGFYCIISSVFPSSHYIVIDDDGIMECRLFFSKKRLSWSDIIEIKQRSSGRFKYQKGVDIITRTGWSFIDDIYGVRLTTWKPLIMNLAHRSSTCIQRASPPCGRDLKTVGDVIIP